jgi:ketosteroid isomerase-like protein
MRFMLFSVLVCVVALAAASCAGSSNPDGDEAMTTVQAYLDAMQAGDLEKARSYWTDVNHPDGSWNKVARRDMEHVTLGHQEDFKGGVEMVEYLFDPLKEADKEIGVVKLDVRVQPDDRIMKLEIGLVRHNGRWYIYSIYPGGW